MVKALALSIFVLCFFALGSSTHVKFANCGGETVKTKIDYVDISPCTAQPCELKKGTSDSVAVQFIPSSNITSAKTVVHGIIEGVPVPFPVENPDPCKEHGINCPMTGGETYVFKTVLPIKSEYPAIELVVKWEMHDQDDKVVFCWELPVKIVS